MTPRTVYLWIRAGKLRAVRVSERVTRIPVAEIARLLASPNGAVPPPDLSSVLWDLDTSRIDFETNARHVIERILEAGRPAQVRWMFQRYSVERVLEVAQGSRALSHRAAVAWVTLLTDRLGRAA